MSSFVFYDPSAILAINLKQGIFFRQNGDNRYNLQPEDYKLPPLWKDLCVSIERVLDEELLEYYKEYAIIQVTQATSDLVLLYKTKTGDAIDAQILDRLKKYMTLFFHSILANPGSSSTIDDMSNNIAIEDDNSAAMLTEQANIILEKHGNRRISGSQILMIGDLEISVKGKISPRPYPKIENRELLIEKAEVKGINYKDRKVTLTPTTNEEKSNVILYFETKDECDKIHQAATGKKKINCYYEEGVDVKNRLYFKITRIEIDQQHPPTERKPLHS